MLDFFLKGAFAHFLHGYGVQNFVELGEKRKKKEEDETSPGPIQSTTNQSKQNTSGDKRKSKDENKPHTNKCIALINGCGESQR